MKKIPTVFQRNPQDMRHVLPEVTPGCEWVLAGEGVATRKYDGTCVRLDESGWWARREVKPGKTVPANFRPVEFDPVTERTVGWEPVEQSSFARWFLEAFRDDSYYDGVGGGFAASTYELVGPKINGNPERHLRHVLIRHADAERFDGDGVAGLRTYELIRAQVLDLAGAGWEGLVYHHPDGRMAKIKARDYA